MVQRRIRLDANDAVSRRRGPPAARMGLIIIPATLAIFLSLIAAQETSTQQSATPPPAAGTPNQVPSKNGSAAAGPAKSPAAPATPEASAPPAAASSSENSVPLESSNPNSNEAKSKKTAGASGSPEQKSQADPAATATDQPQPSRTIPFEYSPYRIHLWVAAEASSSFDDLQLDEIRHFLAQRADAVVGSPWAVTVAPPPDSLYQTVASCPELLTAAAVGAARKDVLKDDKLILVNLSSSPRDWQIWTRELDCRTRIWGPIVKRSERQPAALSNSIFQSVVAAFGPSARIEEGQGKTCVVRGRATGLITEPDSPAEIGKGDILQPIYRQNDRLGNPIPGKTEALPFTFLQITSNDPLSPHLFNCNVHSGMRNPIHGRSISTSRRERWAIKVRPRFDSTVIMVESKVIRRNDPKVPLAGIEVFAKTPEPEPPKDLSEEERLAAEKKNPAQLVGITDWRGSLAVSPNGATLQLFYLKNGGLLLARLPVVPGLDERLVAEIPDDNPRLQAEGFVRGMNSEVTDLVVQRQLIAVRMRRKISEGKTDEAEKLFEEFRGLKTLNDLQQMLNVQLQRQKPTSSPAVKQKIDMLYGDERELLAKYIDAELQVKLLAELTEAKKNPKPVEDPVDPVEPDNPLAPPKEDKKESKVPAALQPKGGTKSEPGSGTPASPPPASGDPASSAT